MGSENPSSGARIVRVFAHRDYPPGCGPNSSGSTSVHRFSREFPFGCGPSSPHNTEFCFVERNSRVSGCSSSHWRRPVSAVRSYPSFGAKMAVKNPKKPKIMENNPQYGEGQLAAENAPQEKSKEMISLGAETSKTPEMVTEMPHLEKGKEMGPLGAKILEVVTNMLLLEKVEEVGLLGAKTPKQQQEQQTPKKVTGVYGLSAKTPKIVPKRPLMEKGKEMGSLCAKPPTMVPNMPLLEKDIEVVGSEERTQREKVLEMLRLFRERCAVISRTQKGVKRVDVKAYAELKKEGKIVNQNASMIGRIPGVEVGDRFQYRFELLIVGLHRLLQGGIDSMEFGGGKLATCVVANEGHFDQMNDPNVLVYVGEGGTLPRSEVGNKLPPDQVLKGGNRALVNSMKEKKVVRVVRGLKLEVSRSSKIVYVYDGLYVVEGCKNKKGPQGNMIFEFHLTRCPGQSKVPWKNCRSGRL